MPDTGWVIAGTGADDISIGVVAWSTPDRITADDASRAVVIGDVFEPSHFLKATNFGLQIPADATIDGVMVRRQSYNVEQNPNLTDFAVYLVLANGVIGDTGRLISEPWGTAEDELRAYGSSTDLWGEALTDEDVMNPNFGWVMSVLNDFGAYNAQVDVMEIRVYYTLPHDPTAIEPDYTDFPMESVRPPLPDETYHPVESE